MTATRLTVNWGDERLPERFWNKVSPEPNGGCWLWTGAAQRGGYGSFGVRSYVVDRAYRVAYRTLVGEIPAGLYLDHLCRNPACVNPLHLEPVTNATNTLRGEGPTAQNARKTECHRGHVFDDANTIITRKGLRRCRQCKRDGQHRAWLDGTTPRWSERMKRSAARTRTNRGGESK